METKIEYAFSIEQYNGETRHTEEDYYFPPTKDGALAMLEFWHNFYSSDGNESSDLWARLYVDELNDYGWIVESECMTIEIRDGKIEFLEDEFSYFGEVPESILKLSQVQIPIKT